MNEVDTPIEEVNDGAGFDEGFANAPSEPTETPVQDDDEQPSPEPAIEYAQLTKAQYDELIGLKATQEKSFGTAFGKLGGIERTLQQIQSGPQVEISQEDIDALREDFPPLAAALEKVRNMRSIPGGGMDPTKLDELVQQRIAPALSELTKQVESSKSREFKRLARRHPDFRQIDESEEFKGWVAGQSEVFKEDLFEASQDFDSEAIADVITEFKNFRKKSAAQQAVDSAAARRSRMSAAVTPRGSGSPAGSDPLDDFNAGFQNR